MRSSELKGSLPGTAALIPTVHEPVFDADAYWHVCESETGTVSPSVVIAVVTEPVTVEGP